MTQSGSFKIYKVESDFIINYGESYLISTEYKNDSSHHFGENFIFIDSRNPTLEILKMKFNNNSIPKEIFEYNSELMFYELINRAKLSFNKKRFEKFKETDRPGYLLSKISFVECEALEVKRAWTINLFHKEIESAAKTTESESLKEFLKHITKLPFVEFEI